MTKSFLSFIAVIIIISPAVFAPVSAQKPAAEKFKDAIERSEDSARLMSLLAEPNSGFPKELIDKAQIVAVFPQASKQEALVRRVLLGYGVISARQKNGWSLPVFYQFLSAPRKFSGTSEKTLALVLLFMNKDAASWFEKDKSKFKGDHAGILGPVGAVTEEQLRHMAEAPIVAYTYYNGKLNGSRIDPDFFKDFILDQDNNINLPLYIGKGHEVLTGKKIDSALIPSGISAFQEALQKHWPAR
jgi:lipid-binding SYLF domain-containing protein